MIRKSLCLAALIITACSQESPEAEAPTKATAAPPRVAAPAPAQAAPAKARLVEERNDLLEFTYGWPAEAAAIPKLNAQFEEALAERRAEAVATAREDKAARDKDAPYNSHYYTQVWETFGSNPLLLSLASEIGTFTGGAHGNATYSAMLWYKSADRRIETKELFGNPAGAFKAMTQSYCAELDKQRAEKRGEELPLEGADWMVECPPLAEQVIVPVDGNKDGKFELLRVLIGPYGAGPYAEGTYEVDLPVTPAIRGLLKPEFAGAF